MSKRSYSVEEKYQIIKALEDHYSINEMESIYNVHHSTILEWKHKYDKYGLEGLKGSSNWKKYSKGLKLAAIRDCLSGNYSIRQVARMYEISDASVLRQWIRNAKSC
jgi:transposase-like protein